MKIGVIVPTQNNRPRFLERCKLQIARQTRQPDELLIVDYEKKTFPVDLTERYRYGFDLLKDKVDLIFMMEDDDYYAPNYIEKMLEWWEDCGRPELFGLGETHFYHIGLKRLWRKEFPNMACAFCTVITPAALDKVKWEKVHELITDKGLWDQLNGVAVTRRPIVAIGIKHGIGFCGAAGHSGWFYDKDPDLVTADPEGKWLTDQMGAADAQWYIEQGQKREA